MHAHTRERPYILTVEKKTHIIGSLNLEDKHIRFAAHIINRIDNY